MVELDRLATDVMLTAHHPFALTRRHDRRRSARDSWQRGHRPWRSASALHQYNPSPNGAASVQRFVPVGVTADVQIHIKNFSWERSEALEDRTVLHAHVHVGTHWQFGLDDSGPVSFHGAAASDRICPGSALAFTTSPQRPRSK